MKLLRSRSHPFGIGEHAQIVLLFAEGCTDETVSARFGVTGTTAGKSHRRFIKQACTKQPRDARVSSMMSV
jgi:hypothetical protein